MTTVVGHVDASGYGIAADRLFSADGEIGYYSSKIVRVNAGATVVFIGVAGDMAACQRTLDVANSASIVKDLKSLVMLPTPSDVQVRNKVYSLLSGFSKLGCFHQSNIYIMLVFPTLIVKIDPYDAVHLHWGPVTEGIGIGSQMAIGYIKGVQDSGFSVGVEGLKRSITVAGVLYGCGKESDAEWCQL